jgi:hypothetical protein
MNGFPILAVLTIGISVAILQASFNDLREAPLSVDVTGASNPLRDQREAVARQLALAQQLALANTPWTPAPPTRTIYEAYEGQLDRELASKDPTNAWLSRYLTPAAD